VTDQHDLKEKTMSLEHVHAQPTRHVLAPATLEDAWRVSQHLAATSFVPVGMRGDREAVFAVCVWASEVGVGVIQALNGVHIIEGRVSIKPEMMRALIRAAGHELAIRVSDEQRCTVWGRRSDTGEELDVTWTLDDARRANLAHKDVWKKYPRAMLLARATSELGRALFSAEIAGLGYGPDEIAHDMARGELPAAVAAEYGEPINDDDEPAAVVDPIVDAEVIDHPTAPSGRKVSQAKMRALFAALHTADIGEDDRRPWASELLGRHVTSFTELTSAEVDVLLAALADSPAAGMPATPDATPAAPSPAGVAQVVEMFPGSEPLFDHESATEAWRERLRAAVDGNPEVRKAFVAWCRNRKVSNVVDKLSDELVRDACLHILGH
jgi:hypothetical protein